MARATLFFVLTSVLIVLASFAGQPPNLEKALTAQQELIRQQPYDPRAHNDLGNLLLVAGRAAEAEQADRQAVQLDPRNTSARFNLAILLQQSSRPEDAMSELRQVVEIDPYHAWAHYQLGVQFDRQQDRSKALEHYARAFAYDPALTFAETNPHIIDNRLSTEALLMSQRYRVPQAAGVPRLYSNPDRIVDLMLAEEEDETEVGAGEASPEEGTPSSATDSRLPSGTPGSGESDLRAEPSPDEEDDGSQRRVLTPASVGGGGRNQAEAIPQPSTPSSRAGDRFRQAFEERFRAARERAEPHPSTRGSSTGSDAGSSSDASGTPPPSGRPRYIPGRNSTGRLEIELRLPPAPAERHAALGGSASAS